MQVEGQAWFGGGADLTPAYLCERDAGEFHSFWHELCSKHRVGLNLPRRPLLRNRPRSCVSRWIDVRPVCISPTSGKPCERAVLTKMLSYGRSTSVGCTMRYMT